MKKEIVYCDRCGEEYRPVWGRIGEDYRILGYMGCKSTYQLHRTFLNKDITLSLNEKIILEIINEENQSFLENHQAQINQLILCNEFISLVKKKYHI